MERRSASFQHPRESEVHRRKLHQAQRRFILLAAGIVGIFAGAVAVGFEICVRLVGDVGAFIADKVSDLGLAGWTLLLVFGAVAGGVAGWLTERFAPEAGGSG